MRVSLVIVSVASMLCCIVASGQGLARDVIASSGQTHGVGEFSFASTIGQTVVGRSFSFGGSLNQGFHQPRAHTQEVVGCLDEGACNYNPMATVTDDSCDFISCLIGCTNPSACNFDNEVIADDGSCDFSCCPGPGCCNDGTHWDEISQTCIVSEPADINFDGCVQLNDLLDLLSAYGNCSN